MSPGQAKLIMKGLTQNKELRNKYKDTYKKIESFLKKQQEEKTSKQPKVIIRSVSITSFSISSYPLANSFILDCSSPLHICNDLDRFDPSTYQKLDRADPILTGDSCSYVEGYGEVHIKINTSTGQQLFQLKNVAYILGFYTNIVFYKKLR